MFVFHMRISLCCCKLFNRYIFFNIDVLIIYCTCIKRIKWYKAVILLLGINIIYAFYLFRLII